MLRCVRGIEYLDDVLFFHSEGNGYECDCPIEIFWVELAVVAVAAVVLVCHVIC